MEEDFELWSRELDAIIEAQRLETLADEAEAFDALCDEAADSE